MSEKEDPKEHDEELEFNEYEEEEVDPTPSLTPSPADATHAATPSPKPEAAAATPNPAPTPEKMPLGEMAISVVIESARIPLTLDKLLQLQKGNVLELPRLPEEGVDLVVNGNLIAKAELIKIGDRLAVRILDI